MPKKQTSNTRSNKTDQSKEIADLTNALQRERADAINLRRRHEADMTSLRLVVKANIIRELLPVIDNFERALKHVPKGLDDDPYIKGVEAVVKQFEKTLNDLGVKKLKTVNEPFDPKYHEAVSLEEGPGNTEIVSEELQAGYELNGEVI